MRIRDINADIIYEYDGDPTQILAAFPKDQHPLIEKVLRDLTADAKEHTTDVSTPVYTDPDELHALGLEVLPDKTEDEVKILTGVLRRTISHMSQLEEEMAEVRESRDETVREMAQLGVTNYRIAKISGLAQPTVARILAAE